MTYFVTENKIISQPIASTSATLGDGLALGTIVKAKDPVYGEGEFVYLLGVASTVVGSAVVWDGQSGGTPTYQTALAPATAGLGKPLAFAMSANVAAQYGWYQFSGQAVVATNGTFAAAGVKAYCAGAGQLTTTQANGVQVVNATSVTATGTPAAGQAVLLCDRPSAQGQIV